MARFAAVVSVACLALLAACGGDPSGGGKHGESSEGKPVVIGKDGVPVDANGKPIPPKLEGRYELSSQFDLTTLDVLPPVANGTLKALSNFREHPSQTIADLMTTAHVPLVSTTLDLIPSAVRDYVLGYIDDHVFSALYEAVPVTERITGLTDDLASILTKFEVVTTLDLPHGDEIGNAKATHALTGVAYHWDSDRHVISLPEAAHLVEHVDANAVALDKLSPKLESGRLTLGDHTFSVPIGSFAVKGADELAKAKFGAQDLRSALGKFVDCDGLADVVSKKCDFTGYICVGHATEIAQLCTSGLDLVVDAIKAEIQQLDLPIMHFQEGLARMWDAATPGGPLDAIVDRIDDGYWRATVGKATNLVISFSGHRIDGDNDSSNAPH